MKRLLVAVIVAVLLAGCGGQDTPETTQDTADLATHPSSQGLYDPDSEVEQQTDGAVRAFDLGKNGYHRISAIGDKLLLVSGETHTELTVLSGAACVPTATGVFAVDLLQGGCQATYNGFAYYDVQNNQAVFLDSQLQEVNRIQLPEGVQGLPAFSADGGEIFYCIGQEIRALDTQRGLSRLIKSHSVKSQTLLRTCFDGKLLVCRAENEAGQWSTLYISSETGETRSTDENIESLDSFDEQYLVIRMDGSIQQRIVGTLDGMPQQMNVPQEHVVPALALGGIVGYDTDDSNGMHMSYYELSSGKKTASVTVTGVGAPMAFWADRWTGCVWILVNALEEDSQQLLRWDVKASSVSEEGSYLSPVFTAQEPDKAGLTACQKRVDELNKKHGTTIRIWEKAAKCSIGQVLEAEHQTVAINRCLDELELVLERFPENFLYKSVNSKIRICIVRSIDRNIAAAQYWYDGDAFIVLSVGVDVQKEFIKAVSYVIDSHVLGNSPMLDQWESLNPEGFVYGNDAQLSSEYLEGESRAFADSESMLSVSEDRAHIFWYAMQEDNAVVFTSDAMQKKLLLLCQAIRDAWRLEKKTENYPWEQYLTESIAYQK